MPGVGFGYKLSVEDSKLRNEIAKGLIGHHVRALIFADPSTVKLIMSSDKIIEISVKEWESLKFEIRDDVQFR